MLTRRPFSSSDRTSSRAFARTQFCSRTKTTITWLGAIILLAIHLVMEWIDKENRQQDSHFSSPISWVGEGYEATKDVLRCCSGFLEKVRSLTSVAHQERRRLSMRFLIREDSHYHKSMNNGSGVRIAYVVQSSTLLGLLLILYC